MLILSWLSLFLVIPYQRVIGLTPVVDRKEDGVVGKEDLSGDWSERALITKCWRTPC
jgi:hypothetical protein